MTEGVGRSAWHGIEVRHLAALQALAEEASFHGAARRLGYSQPAVSQQLAALERIVGTQLVNRPRVSQPLTLTDAGERLLVHARAIQASLATAEAELGAGGTIQLRVGTYQTVAGLILPHVVRELARTDPGIEVLSDDRVILIDMPAWCRSMGHGFLGARQEGEELHLFIRKQEGKTRLAGARDSAGAAS